jgi:hypothetical protein
MRLEKSVSKSMEQQSKTLKILERELNKSKSNLAKLKDEKYNQLKMIEINTYFGKRYNAHANLMKTIVIVCIPIIILAILTNNGILPSTIYKVLVIIILVIGSIFVGMQIIDMSNRDDMNWDEYNWNFNKSQAPVDTTFASNTSSLGPWSTPTVTCIGSACCSDGSSYDTEKNVCVPNKETFRNLDKYGYTHFTTSSLNNNFMPSLSNMPKF